MCGETFNSVHSTRTCSVFCFILGQRLIKFTFYKISIFIIIAKFWSSFVIITNVAKQSQISLAVVLRIIVCM